MSIAYIDSNYFKSKSKESFICKRNNIKLNAKSKWKIQLLLAEIVKTK